LKKSSNLKDATENAFRTYSREIGKRLRTENIEILVKLALLPQAYGGTFVNELCTFEETSEGYKLLQKEYERILLIDQLSNSGLARLYKRGKQIILENFYPFAERFIREKFQIANPLVIKTFWNLFSEFSFLILLYIFT